MIKTVKIVVLLLLLPINSSSQNVDFRSSIVFTDTIETTDGPDTAVNEHQLPDLNRIPENTERDSQRSMGDSTALNDTTMIKTMLDSLGIAVSEDSTGNFKDSIRGAKQDRNRRTDDALLYAGTSKDMNHIASEVVLDAYRGNWSEVTRGLERLQRIERRRDLVNISKLLNVSVRMYRLEQNEFSETTERNAVEKEIDSCIIDGLSYTEKFRDNRLPIHELIYCGVRGFQVSRMIGTNPIEAAIQGYAVIVRLEKLLGADSTMYDAYLGLGLFYCSVASAPSVIRAALALTGRQITLEKGLSYLRTGAQKGQYVNIPSLVYLTQFLSPYLGHHVSEKDSIFMLLQKKCVPNPRYLFEQIDENICFHPEVFTPEYIAELRKRIAGYKNTPSQLRHYFELMKYQYCDYIDTLNWAFKKDPAVDLKEFQFYPLFMDGLRSKEMCMINSIGSFSKLRLRDCEKNIPDIIGMLDKSSMISPRRDFYKWHVRDAFKSR